MVKSVSIRVIRGFVIFVPFRSIKSEYQPFFEAFDCEEANDEDKGNDVKQVEQQMRRVLMGADGADEADRVGQGDNLGERTNEGREIRNREDHA